MIGNKIWQDNKCYRSSLIIKFYKHDEKIHTIN